MGLELLEPIDYMRLYRCLNGKGESCIERRTFGNDKVQCALRNVYKSSTSKESLIKVLIQNTINYMPVVLKELINRIYLIITLDDGDYLNEYNSKHESGIKLYNKNIHTNGDIKKTLKDFFRGNNLDSFFEKVGEYLLELAKENPVLLYRLGVYDSPIESEIKLGDVVMIKENTKYYFTKYGSIGKVIRRDSNGDYIVKFYLVTGDLSKKLNEYNINKRYMQKLNIINCDNVEFDGTEMMRIFSIIKNLYFRLSEESENNSLVDTKLLFVETASKELLNSGFILKQGNEYILNRAVVTDFIAPELTKSYSDNLLYSSKKQFSPPAEQQPNVLRLELTQGCSHNKCTYCSGYKDIPFRIKTYEEFKNHFSNVLENIGDYHNHIDRVFVGGGDALSVEQSLLTKTLALINLKLDLSRISMYARTISILDKNTNGLNDLYDEGLNMLYWGVETGSSKLLKYVNKGKGNDNLHKAVEILNDSSVPVSIMIMPGLGGLRYYDEHILQTVSLLNELNINYITFMSVNPSSNSVYSKIMARESLNKLNRPLNDAEIVAQVRDIVSNLKTRGYKIGMFGAEIDLVAKNPIIFNERLDQQGQKKIIRQCQKYLDQSLKYN